LIEQPTLVFLHEGLGSAELWRDFPAHVGDAVRAPTFVYSRAGYGHAQPITGPRPVTYMHDEAKELKSLLADHGIDRPVLVGHSDGASIAIIAAGSGLPVTGLVLLAPHVFVEERSVAGIQAAKASYEEGDLRERLARYHDDVDGAFLGWNDVWLSPEFRSWDITSYLPAITCPVLLVQSVDDPYGTLAQLDAVESGVRGPVERLVLPGDAHAPQVDHPEAVIDAVAHLVARAAAWPEWWRSSG
jgi:pimeloyl-ACP methyl ester carboxylesterase